MRGEPALHLRHGDGLADLGVEALERSASAVLPGAAIANQVRTSKSEMPSACSTVGTSGNAGVARVARDRERAQLSGLDVLDRQRRRRERELDFAGEKRGDDRRVAAIGHVQELAPVRLPSNSMPR